MDDQSVALMLDGITKADLAQTVQWIVGFAIQLYVTVKVLSVKLDGLTKRVDQTEENSERAHQRIDSLFIREVK